MAGTGRTGGEDTEEMEGQGTEPEEGLDTLEKPSKQAKLTHPSPLRMRRIGTGLCKRRFPLTCRRGVVCTTSGLRS